ncbi:larval cuticle protein LCP-17-like [Penaeus chinensis]|uniref:larval cuticle protein LCP-17-like n=1 Tax=Penaeus chinensis TaxID=139456 RepID=UPI001FB5D18D|nr:larval cuticle protein LCP-17-like [Penaeus chinensis]
MEPGLKIYGKQIWFTSGKYGIEFEPCSGRPSTSVCEENIDVVRDTIEKDRRITSESVTDTLNISVDSVHKILVQSINTFQIIAESRKTELAKGVYEYARIVFACLAAVAVAAPQLQERVVELLRDERVANEDGTFSYVVEADNGINTAVSGSIGAEGQINQEGSYTVILEDGTQAIVSFVANENGFQPQSSILPTPHPLPEHVFELLEIAERQRAEGIVFE